MVAWAFSELTSGTSSLRSASSPVLARFCPRPLLLLPPRRRLGKAEVSRVWTKKARRLHVSVKMWKHC